MTTTEEPLAYAERRGAVSVVTLNRPERLNAWTNELEDRYFELLDEAEADPEVRAIVVTGAGRGFCAGADMAELQRIGSAGDAGEERPKRERPRWYPLSLRKPLIGAINGAAAGLGFVEALYFDVRFSTPEAKFTTSFARRGLIAEYGVAWLLPRLVGPARAADLLLSGRVVRGAEAYEMGLVNRVVERDRLLGEAVAYAEELATWCSPTSMSVMKQQLSEAFEVDFETAARRAEVLMEESFGRADAAEGVASYLEGREPGFRPLSG
ncbi:MULTISPECIES: enoyl-CoA hydratase-related protein [unclassified Streptomyces]|uniref:enoyl-CoA hydratase-related protein n=1 Tax=unclassified Streptomyces TaxID=2593676 RepID=UPI00278BE181|nr:MULTISPECIES: enoyl-CoA hydratase-related protein [unclassified Streptomyces]